MYSCGLVVVRFTSSFPTGIFSIDGQTINPTSITAVQQISTDCTQMANYPATFKTAAGEVAIKKTPLLDYTVSFPSHTLTRQVSANACGYAVLKNTNTTLLNLPTATGGRANFAYANLPVLSPLSCVKGTMYFASGFNVRSAIASATTATTATSTTATSTTTTQTAASTVSSQTALPVAAKSGNNLIISSIPPGTYTVANTANLSQSKVYTVTSKGCLVGDRTQIGSPSKFLVSRQGLTFPIDWASLPTVPAATIPQC